MSGEPHRDEQQVATLYRLVRLMCDNAPDLIWAKDLENRYTFCNRAMCQVLLNAVDAEEPIGKTDMFFATREREAHPENPHWHTFGEICRDSDTIVVASRTPGRFDEYGRVRGEMLYLDVFKAPLFDERGELIGTVGCGRIVTQERRLAEKQRLAVQALRENALRNRALLNALPDLVFAVSREGVFLEAHGVSAELALPPEAFINRPLEVALPPELAAEVRRRLDLAFATAEVQAFEYLLPVGGVDRFWEARLAPCDESMALVIVRDITAQRRAEEELRRSEERLRALVEHALIGIYRTAPDGRVLMANPAAVRMAGYASFEEFARANLEEASQRGTYDRQRFLEAIERDGAVVGFENTWTRPDGMQVFVRENARAVRDAAGRTLYYEGTIEDLTQRRQLEEQLRQAQKVEAVGRVAGGIAHDFNNVMQAILSLVPLLRARREDTQAHDSTLGELEEEIERGAGLTRQLLLFSRREIARPQRLDLNEAVRTSATMLRRLLRENITLSLELADVTLPVEVDRSQLDQVILNLVINAGDAMPSGGPLAVRTGFGPPGEVWVEVEDRGSGIPDDVLEHIFEPFFTTKRADRGTGLGLAVAHTIVTERGGRFEVTSRFGSGSTFRAVFPRAEGPLSELAARTGSTFELVGHGEHVLVVEDEASAREGLCEVLTHMGYNVTACATGEEALALPNETPVALLLTDLLLPGVHGWELSTRLCERWPELRVIVMSGYSQDESVRRSVKEGTIRFLQKPFSAAALSREVSQALADRAE